MARATEAIWIDLDNSPHVPLFRPVVPKLEERGYKVVLSARRCSQVCGIADKFQMKYQLIGRHHGKNKIIKLVGLLLRAMQLIPFAAKLKPVAALSHGSRSQMIAAKLLRMPSIHVADYEHIKMIPFFSDPRAMIVPEVLKDFYSCRNDLYCYPGIKEDIYVPFFKPNDHEIDELKVRDEKLLVTVRPPAVEAHYHVKESELLFEAALEYLMGLDNTRVVLLPRNEKQSLELERRWSSQISDRKIVIPDHVVDGLNLIWYSDFVISGGGTMNREAAALGVPVYSIFRGTIGAVDEYLSRTGRLTLIETPEDLPTKVALAHRQRPALPEKSNFNTLNAFVDIIVSIVGRIR